jgi:hypothetical protein
MATRTKKNIQTKTINFNSFNFITNQAIMSLFKILQQFSYQCPDGGENYDSYSLKCARLNADNEQQKDSVIVTSHSGYISILQPSISGNADGEMDNQQSNASEYHPHVIYEAKLNEPIIGLLSGQFTQ